jgi:hypothetical protein
VRSTAIRDTDSPTTTTPDEVPCMTPTTPAAVRAALESDVKLRTALTRTGVLNSPALLDLVLWNVVVAFVVNVTASVLYDEIRRRRSRDGTLTQKDLQQLAELLDKPIEGFDPSRVEGAAQEAAQVLEDHGIPDGDAAVREAVRKTTRSDVRDVGR